MSGLEEIQNEHATKCDCLSKDLLQMMGHLIQKMTTQNELMTQLIEQNNELIDSIISDDDDADLGYLDDSL